MSFTVAPVCKKCHLEYYDWAPTKPCEKCQRMVVNLPRFNRKHTFCCKSCEVRYYSHRRKKSRSTTDVCRVWRGFQADSFRLFVLLERLQTKELSKESRKVCIRAASRESLKIFQNVFSLPGVTSRFFQGVRVRASPTWTSTHKDSGRWRFCFAELTPGGSLGRTEFHYQAITPGVLFF